MRLQELFTNEGISDPGIFKAVFLAGGPGSGKSTVANELLKNTGLKVVNTDTVFEMLMDKEGLRKDMPDDEDDARNIVRGKAKAITGRQQSGFIAGRLGLIIDGTAKAVGKTKTIKGQLEKIGYDTRMIFINTTLDVAQQRNTKRFKDEGGRQVKPTDLEKMWNGAQKNIKEYQEIFPDHFYEIDNSAGVGDPTRQETIDIVWKALRKFLEEKPNSPAAKKWLSAEEKRDRTPDKSQLGRPEVDVHTGDPPISPGFDLKNDPHHPY